MSDKIRKSVPPDFQAARFLDVYKMSQVSMQARFDR
jgi:hypothetical protein